MPQLRFPDLLASFSTSQRAALVGGLHAVLGAMIVAGLDALSGQFSAHGQEVVTDPLTFALCAAAMSYLTHAAHARLASGASATSPTAPPLPPSPAS